MKKMLPYLAIAFVVTSVGCYFRLYPFLFRISSDSEEKAVAVVYAQLRANVEQTVEGLYPTLEPGQKQALADQRFNEILAKRQKQIQKTIFSLAQKIYGRALLDDPQAKEPEIYLPDSDSYYFYGLTKQLAQNQKIMTKRRGAEYFNDLMLAPIGYWEKINLHPFVGYYTYRLLKLFDPQISVMLAVSFLPVFLTMLSSVLFILLLKQLRIRFWATLLGSVLFILAPIFLRRSFFGWYDNDIYNVFFPLLILGLTFLAVENYEDRKKRTMFALLTGLGIVGYAFFWQGWVYLFCVIVAGWSSLLAAEHFIFKKKKETLDILSIFSISSAAVFIGIVASFGLGQFFSLFKEGWSVLNDFFHSADLSLWPDMYISVGELSRTSWQDLTDLTGSLLWLLAAAAGIAGFVADVVYRPCRKTIYKMLFVLIFFITAFVIAMKAQRFVLLFITPLGLLAAYGLEKIFAGFEAAVEKFGPSGPSSRLLKPVLLGLVMAALFVPALVRADDLASRIRPIFNPVWEKALVEIKEKTPPGSIINTWWPPGHFIKSIAQRRVTSDGATINVPQAYWMARVFYSPSEKKALGILRMLNTSANKASEYLLGKGKKLSEAVDILEEIVVLPKNKAKQFLQIYLSPSEADALLLLTHGQPPPSYLFLYNDLMETNIGVGFASRWNIKKIEQINQDPSMLRQIRRLSPEDFISFLWDMQGGMLHYSEVLNQVGKEGTRIYFDNGLMVDQNDMSVQVASAKFGNGIPQSIFYESDLGPTKKEFLNANLRYSVFLFKVNDGRYGCILLDEVIGESLLVRLYFRGPKDFRYLESWLNERDLTGRTEINVFRVNWERFLDDLGENP